MSQPAVLAVHTAVPGRARFSVPGLKRNDRVKRALEAGLAGRGIRSISASTATGTVLVLFETGHDLVEITRRLGESAGRAFDPDAPEASSARPSWHAMDADSVIGAVNSHPAGLSEAEAKRRLAETGANAIAPISGRTQLEILLSQFRSLPIALLAAGAALSVASGGLFDAAIILGVIGLNGAIGFIAEARAEETIGSLRESRAPAARALRGGKESEVPAEQLVPGDLIELRRDEIVPADARVIMANRMTVNEAMLTGESAPVVKAANVLAPQSAPIGDRHNMVFRGTVVTGGAGRAVVTATGLETELGRIQSLLGSENQPATPLQRQLDALGRQLVFGSIAACGLFAAIGLVRGFGLLSLLKTVTSLAVAAVPEGLPTLATTTLALAIQDLRQRRIIIRRLSAVEGLAAVEIACFDKTGTLTLNDMSVVRLYWNEMRARLVDEQFRTSDGSPVDCTTDRELARLLELAILCNDVELLDAAASDANGSATEMALLRAAIRAGLDVDAARGRQPRRSTLERAEDRRYMVTVHDAGADQKLVIVKGDPIEVLALCRWRLHNAIVVPLEAEDRRTIEAENLAMAEDALRVLGIAYRSAGVEDHGMSIDQNFIWAGLVGMADPIRKGAPDLIAAFRGAGITSIMLTGDQRATAAAVATELGLLNGSRAEIVEAAQLEEFEAATGDGNLPLIFARVAPGQKLQLVKKLQASGRVVAMIGDGVNDTPPLRAADIGIALGRSGGEAARGIADVVLLEDDLASLTDAVERGRTVAINIRKAIRYLVATNLSEIIFMLVAAAAGRAHPLSPIQLLWINLLTDVLPALGLAMEPAAPDLMTRPPRDPQEPVISAAEFGTLARDAGLIAASAFVAQACAARLGGSARSAQTVGFNSLVSAQLFYAFACRSRRGLLLSGRTHPPNPFFFGALGCAFAAQGAALFIPGFRNLFGPALGIADFGISLAAGAAPVLAIQALRKAQSDPN
jgi:P-type Ca2+ transporter type 2C